MKAGANSLRTAEGADSAHQQRVRMETAAWPSNEKKGKPEKRKLRRTQTVSQRKVFIHIG